ncbi:MAG: ribbon-helix-helix protein, CopG family [Clostridia bacterium]|nr:ribbon-helix-helix protein, CopG family [Clostridia bacterium]
MAELRKIIVSVPSGLLDEVDLFVRKEGRNRSEVVREAMRMYLKEHARAELREQLRDGYLRMASVNIDAARECAVAEEEAFAGYERFLAGD